MGAPEGCKQRVLSVNGLAVLSPCVASNSSVQGICFCLSELPLPEHFDRILINEWVWLELQMHKGWLCAVLCEIFRMKTDGNLT